MSRGSQRYGLPGDNTMGSSLPTYRPTISVWQMHMGEAHLASKESHVINKVEHDLNSLNHERC